MVFFCIACFFNLCLYEGSLVSLVESNRGIDTQHEDGITPFGSISVLQCYSSLKDTCEKVSLFGRSIVGCNTQHEDGITCQNH